MARTYRKRAESFESYFGIGGFRNRDLGDSLAWKSEADLRRIYRNNTIVWYGMRLRLPKPYRKQVSRFRRRKDKREIYKELNHFEYENQCSLWNATDGKLYSYW